MSDFIKLFVRLGKTKVVNWYNSLYSDVLVNLDKLKDLMMELIKLFTFYTFIILSDWVSQRWYWYVIYLLYYQIIKYV